MQPYGAIEYVTTEGKKSLALSGPVCYIGSSVECFIRLYTGDVEDKHCSIKINILENGERQATLSNLSQGKTFLNGKPTRASVLKNGDVIKVGTVQFTWSSSDNSALPEVNTKLRKSMPSLVKGFQSRQVHRASDSHLRFRYELSPAAKKSAPLMLVKVPLVLEQKPITSTRKRSKSMCSADNPTMVAKPVTTKSASKIPRMQSEKKARSVGNSKLKTPVKVTHTLSGQRSSKKKLLKTPKLVLAASTGIPRLAYQKTGNQMKVPSPNKPDKLKAAALRSMFGRQSQTPEKLVDCKPSPRTLKSPVSAGKKLKKSSLLKLSPAESPGKGSKRGTRTPARSQSDDPDIIAATLDSSLTKVLSPRLSDSLRVVALRGAASKATTASVNRSVDSYSFSLPANVPSAQEFRTTRQASPYVFVSPDQLPRRHSSRLKSQDNSPQHIGQSDTLIGTPMPELRVSLTRLSPLPLTPMPEKATRLSQESIVPNKDASQSSLSSPHLDKLFYTPVTKQKSFQFVSSTPFNEKLKSGSGRKKSAKQSMVSTPNLGMLFSTPKVSSVQQRVHSGNNNSERRTSARTSVTTNLNIASRSSRASSTVTSGAYEKLLEQQGKSTASPAHPAEKHRCDISNGSLEEGEIVDTPPKSQQSLVSPRKGRKDFSPNDGDISNVNFDGLVTLFETRSSMRAGETPMKSSPDMFVRTPHQPNTNNNSTQTPDYFISTGLTCPTPALSFSTVVSPMENDASDKSESQQSTPKTRNEGEASDSFTGVSHMTRASKLLNKVQESPSLTGISRLWSFDNDDKRLESPSLEGIREMMQTPAQDAMAAKSSVHHSVRTSNRSGKQEGTPTGVTSPSRQPLGLSQSASGDNISPRLLSFNKSTENLEPTEHNQSHIGNASPRKTTRSKSSSPTKSIEYFAASEDEESQSLSDIVRSPVIRTKRSTALRETDLAKKTAEGTLQVIGQASCSATDPSIVATGETSQGAPEVVEISVATGETSNAAPEVVVISDSDSESSPVPRSTRYSPQPKSGSDNAETSDSDGAQRSPVRRQAKKDSLRVRTMKANLKPAAIAIDSSPPQSPTYSPAPPMASSPTNSPTFVMPSSYFEYLDPVLFLNAFPPDPSSYNHENVRFFNVRTTTRYGLSNYQSVATGETSNAAPEVVVISDSDSSSSAPVTRMTNSTPQIVSSDSDSSKSSRMIRKTKSTSQRASESSKANDSDSSSFAPVTRMTNSTPQIVSSDSDSSKSSRVIRKTKSTSQRASESSKANDSDSSSSAPVTRMTNSTPQIVSSDSDSSKSSRVIRKTKSTSQRASESSKANDSDSSVSSPVARSTRSSPKPKSGSDNAETSDSDDAHMSPVRRQAKKDSLRVRAMKANLKPAAIQAQLMEESDTGSYSETEIQDSPTTPSNQNSPTKITRNSKSDMNTSSSSEGLELEESVKLRSSARKSRRNTGNRPATQTTGQKPTEATSSNECEESKSTSTTETTSSKTTKATSSSEPDKSKVSRTNDRPVRATRKKPTETTSCEATEATSSSVPDKSQVSRNNGRQLRATRKKPTETTSSSECEESEFTTETTSSKTTKATSSSEPDKSQVSRNNGRQLRATRKKPTETTSSSECEESEFTTETTSSKTTKATSSSEPDKSQVSHTNDRPVRVTRNKASEETAAKPVSVTPKRNRAARLKDFVTLEAVAAEPIIEEQAEDQAFSSKYKNSIRQKKPKQNPAPANIETQAPSPKRKAVKRKPVEEIMNVNHQTESPKQIRVLRSKPVVEEPSSTSSSSTSRSRARKHTESTDKVVLTHEQSPPKRSEANPSTSDIKQPTPKPGGRTTRKKKTTEKLEVVPLNATTINVKVINKEDSKKKEQKVGKHTKAAEEKQKTAADSQKYDESSSRATRRKAAPTAVTDEIAVSTKTTRGKHAAESNAVPERRQLRKRN